MNTNAQNRNNNEQKKKVVVVAGGTGCIGNAIVKKMLSEDCKIAVISRGNHQTSDELILNSNKQGLVTFHKADVSREEQVRNCILEIIQIHEKIDFFVYSAGIAPDTDVPLTNYKLEDWENTFDVYVKGFFLCFRECMKVMKPSGHILAISSAVTRFSSDNLPPIYAGHYAASKAALDELLKWGKREAHEKGILLSRIAPAAVDTPFHQNAPNYRKPPAVISLTQLADEVAKALLKKEEYNFYLIPTENPAAPVRIAS